MISIPLVDRPNANFKKNVVVVLDIEEGKFLTGCRAGWIKERLTRGVFTKCK